MLGVRKDFEAPIILGCRAKLIGSFLNDMLADSAHVPSSHRAVNHSIRVLNFVRSK